MKKVVLTLNGWVDELCVGELTQKEFEECKEHRKSPQDYDLDIILDGWIDFDYVYVDVNGKEVFSCEYSIFEETCPQFVNTNPKDWDVSGCSVDQQKALAEEIAALGGNWKEEDSNEVFRNVFGFKRTLLALGIKDGTPVAVKKDVSVQAGYYYKFEIPDDEEFDISKLKFAFDDSKFYSDCVERMISSTIMYDNKPIARNDGEECSSDDIEFGFGTIHTNGTGYIDYIESEIPYFDKEGKSGEE